MAISDTITNLFPNASQHERIAVALEGALTALGTIAAAQETIVENDKSSNDGLYLALLNRTNYKGIMKAWFEYNGSEIMDDLSALCDKWYEITRTGWRGGTRFNDPSISDISLGVKTGDNSPLSCVPSTSTASNTDDYAGIPLFACRDCNWILDADGEPHITAIEGIKSATPFERYNPTRFVGVLQMAGWQRVDSDATSYIYLYTDEIGAAGFNPLPEAVRMDGSIRSWVVHTKYAAGDNLGSYSGAPIRAWDMSHNTCLTGFRSAWGNRYCGRTTADEAFIKWMVYLKYASLTLDGIMNGCVLYQYTSYKPAVAETGVQRVLLTTAQGANLLVGSTVCLGTAAYTSKANQCSVVDRKKIISIETVTISSTQYSAIYIDNGGVLFDTTTAQFLTTMQWYSGACDGVRGNDGSPTNPTGSKEPAMVQGVEILVGGYEIICDSILTYSNDGTTSRVKPYVCRDATQLATAKNASYTACAYDCACQTGANAWQYSKKLGRDDVRPVIMFPNMVGGSSTTYLKDGAYLRGGAALTGDNEWLSLGALHHGAIAGLSCLSAGDALSSATCYIVARLSATGNRGEWTP
jgi:hypothetical protein